MSPSFIFHFLFLTFSSSLSSLLERSSGVMITNCNSLFGKKEAFAETVKSSNPHVILVTETWLKPDISNSECIPDNYTAYRKDRLGRTGGGVLIAVRNDIIATHLEYLDVDAELIWISLQMVNSKPIHICCFYRPPNQGITPIQRLRNHSQRLTGRKTLMYGLEETLMFLISTGKSLAANQA